MPYPTNLTDDEPWLNSSLSTMNPARKDSQFDVDSTSILRESVGLILEWRRS